MMMPLEIERKFLVSGTDWRQKNGIRYSQGYLNLDKERTVRVRLMEKQAFLSVKGITRGASRMEFEYEIPADDAEQLLKLCGGAIIQKIRYTVIHEGTKWEIDEFFGGNKGLIIAEVELDAEDQIFEKPEWLGQEVTDNPRYFNSNLAVNPFKQWDDKSTVANP
jgi:CYTH domain-containing protein